MDPQDVGGNARVLPAAVVVVDDVVGEVEMGNVEEGGPHVFLVEVAAPSGLDSRAETGGESEEPCRAVPAPHRDGSSAGSTRLREAITHLFITARCRAHLALVSFRFVSFRPREHKIPWEVGPAEIPSNGVSYCSGVTPTWKWSDRISPFVIVFLNRTICPVQQHRGINIFESFFFVNGYHIFGIYYVLKYIEKKNLILIIL